MRLIVFIFGIVLSYALASALCAETVRDAPTLKSIPLKEIWAYKMPGTRDVQELEPDKLGVKIRNLDTAERRKRQDESLTFQIVDHLGVTKIGAQAAPAFAVLGTGVEALREAHAVLVKGRKPRQSFPPNSQISVVFFSKVFDYYVHVDKVEQEGNKITVKYFFVPHRGNGTSHFALIPLGTRPAGDVKVEFVRSPLPKSPEGAGFGAPPPATWDSAAVCRTFSFTITDPNVPVKDRIDEPR